MDVDERTPSQVKRFPIPGISPNDSPHNIKTKLEKFMGLVPVLWNHKHKNVTLFAS